jgi:hypothetical protein
MLECNFRGYKINPLEFEGDPDHEVSGRICKYIADRELGQRFDKDLERPSKVGWLG